jgi:hypothetical protein
MYSLIGILIIVGVILLWRRGMMPVANDLATPEEVLMRLQYLLDRGIEGGQVRFQVRDDPQRQLLFVKYIRARNDVGFRSFFYDENWPEGYFDRVRGELDHRGIKYDLSSDKTSKRVLEINYLRDLGLAQLVARLVFERGFGVRLDRDCVAVFKDVLISDHPRLTGVDPTGV